MWTKHNIYRVRSCLLPLPTGLPHRWDFEPFLLLGRSITQTIHSSYNLRVDPTTLGVPTYALHLNRTWVVGTPTNQPNPIQRNVTIYKIHSLMENKLNIQCKLKLLYNSSSWFANVALLLSLFYLLHLAALHVSPLYRRGSDPKEASDC